MIPHILEQHFEEVESLWALWQEAVVSPDYILSEVADLERRLEANTAALVYAGDKAMPLLAERFADDDPAVVSAAAYTLLRLEQAEAAAMVLQALSTAEGAVLDGVREALCQGPIGRIEQQLKQAVVSAEAPAAAAAAEALAFHGRLDPKTKRLAEFVEDENPQVRRSGWRIAGLLPAK